VREYTAFQRRRLTVLPGISGWAQVNGRNAITWEERIKRDVEYTERVSLLLDLRIIARTARAVLARDGLIAERDYFKERALRSRGTH
jgi:undecaprenyl phosphate N,N'-diacetylbacillosamine 1-phosphate transferase